MFTSRKKMTLIEDCLLDQVFDYCLNPNLTERERKIGLMAKQDLEKKRYAAAVVNKFMSSLQLEAMRTGLTKDASDFYKHLSQVMNQIMPIGTNRGSAFLNSSYLD